MNRPEAAITKFIKEHHILHLATADNNRPYCASLFYIYMEEKNTFVFGSKEDTRHIQEALAQKQVAFTIAHHTKSIVQIKGIQALGYLSEFQDKTLKKSYIQKYPLATVIPFKLWGIEPFYIKMTNNRFGFAKKTIWTK